MAASIEGGRNAAREGADQVAMAAETKPAKAAASASLEGKDSVVAPPTGTGPAAE